MIKLINLFANAIVLAYKEVDAVPLFIVFFFIFHIVHKALINLWIVPLETRVANWTLHQASHINPHAPIPSCLIKTDFLIPFKLLLLSARLSGTKITRSPMKV